jgi:hypothetical protein
MNEFLLLILLVVVGLVVGAQASGLIRDQGVAI